MKRLLLFLCVAAVLFLTCSKKSTGPDEPAPPVGTTFEIAYTADPIRSVSQLVSAAAGGSLEAYDKDSVLFELSIPPHALPSDTTITITPFSFLRIGGPGGDACPACAGGDSLCCYRGALFEPSGLILDSPAVLTVHLAPGTPFPFPHGGLIVYLDSAAGSYEPCFTTYDTASGRLQAEITHFSGYGTDDERYDRFEEAIYEAGEELSASVGTWAFYMDLYPLKQLRFTCDGCGHPDLILSTCYPDLVTAIEKIVLDAYSRHAALVRGKAVLQEPCDALRNLYMCFGNIDALFEMSGPWGNFDDFAPIKNDLRNDYVALVYKTGNEGHRLCEADSCDAGMELLACAHDAIRLSNHSGIDFDDEFCASVNNWMLECQDCEIDVSLNADKTTIYDLATSVTDHSTYVNFEVWVRRGLTGHVANQFVVVSGVNATSGESLSLSGTTDIAGIAHLRYVWGYGPSYVSKGDYEMTASVTYGSETHESDTVMITLARAGVKMTYDYQYNYYYMWAPVRTRTITVSIMGAGVRAWANDCPSMYQLTRYFQSVYVDQEETTTLTVNDHPGACFFLINSELATNDEQVVISLLKNVDVEYDFSYTGYAAATSTITTPSDTTTDSVTTEHLDWWMISYENYFTPKWGENYVRMPYNDGFQSLVWDTSGSFPYLTATTHLQIDMSVEK